MSLRNPAATFVFTFRLKGGLNHVIFRFLFRFFLSSLFCSVGSVYWIFSVYPLAESAALYMGAAWLNASMSEELVETRLLIAAGSCFSIFGG